MNDYLFICSANLYRGPTAEHMARLEGLKADSAGTVITAVRRLSIYDLDRANRIVCMEQEHAEYVMQLDHKAFDRLTIWGIPDDYGYCDPDLMKLIRAKMTDSGE